MEEGEARKYSKCIRCNEDVHSLFTAHHLFAIHSEYAKTTKYENPFTENYKSTCPICKCICVRYSLKEHIMNLHQIILLRKCRIEVPQIYKDKKTKMKSLFNEFFPDKDEFCRSVVECPECSEEIVSMEFVQHYHDKHGVKCAVCGVAFATQHQKSYHMLKIHSIDSECNVVQKQKKHMCEICGDFFETRSLVRQHVDATHEKTRRFLCDICGNSFLRKNALRNHRLTHSDIKRYQCKVCLKRVTSVKSIKKHVKKQHNLDSEGRWNNPFLDKESFPWRKLSESEEKALREADQKETEEKNQQCMDAKESYCEGGDEINQIVFNF